MVLYVIQVVVGIGVLILGGECLVRGSASLAKAWGLSPLVIGMTIVAGGTSAPELVVSVMAAAKGNPDICAGNVIGSNIFNMLLILGTAAVICPLQTTATFIRREVPIMIGVMLILTVLVFNGSVSKVEGAILVAVFVIYNAYVIRAARRDAAILEPQLEAIHHAPRRRSVKLSVGITCLGLLGLGGGSELFLRGSIAIAEHFGVSQVMIGLTLVAFGTSLPEWVTSAVAAIRKQPDICLGNIVGSNIFNATAILGLSALVQPVPFDSSLLEMHVPVMLASSIILWPMVATGLALGRREGAALLVGFTIYFGYTLRGQF